MENQDLGLELPRCLWAQLRGNHHHALPDGRAFDLHTEKEDHVKTGRKTDGSNCSGVNLPSYLLQGERGSLAPPDFLHRHSLPVD